MPPDGIVGLRPIHVFGLANILRRPILLLDSVAGMNTSADYSGIVVFFHIIQWVEPLVSNLGITNSSG